MKKVNYSETIIIIIISIFKVDTVFSMTANLPFGPSMNNNIDYYRTFMGLFVSVAMLFVRYLLQSVTLN